MDSYPDNFTKAVPPVPADAVIEEVEETPPVETPPVTIHEPVLDQSKTGDTDPDPSAADSEGCDNQDSQDQHGWGAGDDGGDDEEEEDEDENDEEDDEDYTEESSL